MEDELKPVVGMMAVAMLGVVMESLFTQPEEPGEPPPEESSSVQIEIRDQDGNVLAPGSAVSLDEGMSGTVNVTVTNTSTRGGEPWPATLTLTLSMMAGGVQFLTGGQFDVSYDFAAGETYVFGPYNFYVPYGTGGYTGFTDALISSPTAVPVASASQAIAVVSTVWAATASLSIPSILNEGGAYTGTVTVTNTSMVGTTPVPATMQITIGGLLAGGIQIIGPAVANADFAGGEQQSFTFPITPPWDTGGLAGVIDAVVEITAPVYSMPTSATQNITVTAVPIDYGATITIT